MCSDHLLYFSDDEINKGEQIQPLFAAVSELWSLCLDVHMP